MSSNKKPVALTVSAVLAGGLLLSGSAFASTHLSQGYLLGADAAAKAAQGNCGADKKAAGDKKKDGKCGEAKCGADKDKKK